MNAAFNLCKLLEAVYMKYCDHGHALAISNYYDLVTGLLAGFCNPENCSCTQLVQVEFTMKRAFTEQIKRQLEVYIFLEALGIPCVYHPVTMVPQPFEDLRFSYKKICKHFEALDKDYATALVSAGAIDEMAKMIDDAMKGEADGC